MADGEEKEEENIRTDPRTAIIQNYTLKAFKVAHFTQLKCLAHFFYFFVCRQDWKNGLR